MEEAQTPDPLSSIPSSPPPATPASGGEEIVLALAAKGCPPLLAASETTPESGGGGAVLASGGYHAVAESDECDGLGSVGLRRSRRIAAAAAAAAPPMPPAAVDNAGPEFTAGRCGGDGGDGMVLALPAMSCSSSVAASRTIKTLKPLSNSTPRSTGKATSPLNASSQANAEQATTPASGGRVVLANSAAPWPLPPLPPQRPANVGPQDTAASCLGSGVSRQSPKIVATGNSSGKRKSIGDGCSVPVANGALRQSPKVAATSPVAKETSSGKKGASFLLRKNRRLGLESCSATTEKVESDGEGNGGGPCFFVGEPVPDEKARRRWPHHYVEKGKRSNARKLTDTDDEGEIILDVKCHYLRAIISGSILCIGDCAYVKGPEGQPNYVGRILEFFETIRREYYFTVQWFYRAEDTVMAEQAKSHDRKRLFYSDLKNDNLLDCIVSKVRVVQVPPSVDEVSKSIPSSYFYYDMKYSVDYSTFSTMDIVSGDSGEISDISQSSCSSVDSINGTKRKIYLNEKHDTPVLEKTELALLDLYCGCGGMSTGLCFGTRIAGVNLVARWAIDSDEVACHSLRLNHPETRVRVETADDFLDLLKEWEKLCKKYVNHGKAKSPALNLRDSRKATQDCSTVPTGEYEVLKLVDICYGDPTNIGDRGLKFKVRWKGYSHNDDTWEPIEGLSNCKEAIQDFVIEGHKSKILPLPGDADVICGGPPCQGISGYNRFRNFNAPLEDERNRQIVVFMDIVQFLKPKYVLMENVVDLLKFAKATLARYALSRLVAMNYQARLGIMAAGCYGLPQFRMRVFLLGCHPMEKLPQFPLPTHEAILKYGCPLEFERNLVGYDEGIQRQLEKALVLEDVLSDLPEVNNKEVRDEMPYGKDPQTEFQRYIRTSNIEMLGSKAQNGAKDSKSKLYDHRPLPLTEDDCLRVSQIPKRKGANFRDLPGIIVGPDNKVQLDPTMERILLPSGSPLVPNYTLTFEDGKSSRPFARLWWDEVVATVLTVPNSHSQALIHPVQDRMLTIRESARLQGFPDYYRFHGTVRDRYRQIGNAVAIPVGRALGYAMALAFLKKSGDGPLMTLPPKFAFSLEVEDLSSSCTEVKD